VPKLPAGRPRTSEASRAIHACRRYQEGKDVTRVGDLIAEGKFREADEMQAKALFTVKGKKRWPQLSSVKTAKEKETQDTHEAFVHTVTNNARREQKAGLILLAGAHYTPQQVAQFSKGAITAQRSRNVKHKYKTEKLTTVPIAHGLSSKKRVRIGLAERSLYTRFFSTKVSGGYYQPQRLLLNFHELMEMLYAEYPDRLRRCITSDDSLKTSAYEAKNPNKFQKDIMYVSWCADQEDFDPHQEFLERKKEAEEMYVLKLQNHTANQRRKRWRAYTLHPTSKKKRGQTKKGTFDVETWELKPRSEETFWRIIKMAKIKYTTSWVPHNCPLCEGGIVKQAVMDSLAIEMATNRGDLQKLTGEESSLKIEIARLDAQSDQAKLTELRARAQEIRNTMIQLDQDMVQMKGQERELLEELHQKQVHEDQLEECRPHLYELESNLKVGECIVFRDFVNTTTDNLVKVKNLVLVILWVEQDNGVLHVRKIHNICTDPETCSTDAGYVKHVSKFHLDKQASSGVFSRFHKMTIAGDHGSHFSAVATLFHESTFREKYNMEVNLVFLCSYHAFNRCDKAGQEVVMLGKAKEMRRLGPCTAQHFTDLINASADADATGYPFNTIIREDDLPTFEEGLNLRKQCEFEFFGPGMLRCRPTPGKGLWTVLDIRPPGTRAPNTELCGGCSGVQQVPVAHGKNPCPLQNRPERLPASNGPRTVITSPDQMPPTPGYKTSVFQSRECYRVIDNNICRRKSGSNIGKSTKARKASGKVGCCLRMCLNRACANVLVLFIVV
jgi:hypothetical protein